MRKNLTTFLLVLLVFVLAGCSRVSITNIDNIGYSSYDKKLSMQEINDAIILAGQKLRWNMTKVSDGEISGALTVRQHSANVLIKYRPDMSFSIIYVSSSNLNASATSIHKSYLRWVRNLEKSIGKEFILMLGNKQ